MQFIDLGAQYKHLKNKINKRVQSVLEHGKYIMGPEVYEFEGMLAEYVGVKHVVTCANGTDALSLSMMAIGIKEGDAVFCPTFTFFATAETIAYAKATPVFIDSDESTFNMCPKNLEQQIKRTLSDGKLLPKAIIAVDLFGLPANYLELESIALRYNLKLIEDAAQGFGGEIDGRRAGCFGDLATTSFFPAKPLGCYGDGGAIFTNNDNYAELLRSYRVHGSGKNKYDNVRIGINSRLDTIQAAILIEKLIEFPQELIKRNEIAAEYSSYLKDLFTVPQLPEGYMSSWAQYVLVDSSRDMCINNLQKENIPTAVYYKTCMHQQDVFKNSQYYLEGEYPVAENLAKQVFSLPMSPYLSCMDQQQVLQVLVPEGK